MAAPRPREPPVTRAMRPSKGFEDFPSGSVVRAVISMQTPVLVRLPPSVIGCLSRQSGRAPVGLQVNPDGRYTRQRRFPAQDASVQLTTMAKSAHPLEKVKNPSGSTKSRLLAQRVNAWKTLSYRT